MNLTNSSSITYNRSYLTVIRIFKGYGYTFKEDNFAKLFLTPFWKGAYTTSKELAPLGGKLLPFRVDSFSERVWCARKPRGIYNRFLPCNKMTDSIPTHPKLYQFPLWFKKGINITTFVYLVLHVSYRLTWHDVRGKPWRPCNTILI